MKNSWVLAGANILTPEGEWKKGSLLIEESRIQKIFSHKNPFQKRVNTVDARGLFVIPGLIDLHVNGVGECDLAKNRDAWMNLSNEMARRGVTSFLPALISAPFSQLVRTLSLAVRLYPQKFSGARPLGLHIEGPFLSKERRGVHPKNGIARYSKAKLMQLLLAGEGLVKMMTLAPECIPQKEVAIVLKKRGVLPALGHTDADYAETKSAIQNGFRFATHLYNAMRPLHHRDPGVVGAVLDSPQIAAELISDGAHVSYPAMEMALALKGNEKVILASDELAGAQNGDIFAGQKLKKGAGSWLSATDHTIAGSSLSLLEGICRWAKATKRDWRRLIPLATMNPARAFGLARETGSITAGKKADLAVVSKDLRVQMTVVSGKIVYHR